MPSRTQLGDQIYWLSGLGKGQIGGRLCLLSVAEPSYESLSGATQRLEINSAAAALVCSLFLFST